MPTPARPPTSVVLSIRDDKEADEGGEGNEREAEGETGLFVPADTALKNDAMPFSPPSATGNAVRP